MSDISVALLAKRFFYAFNEAKIQGFHPTAFPTNDVMVVVSVRFLIFVPNGSIAEIAAPNHTGFF